MSVVTQSQLALAQQWYAHLAARKGGWPWQVGDWASLGNRIWD